MGMNIKLDYIYNEDKNKFDIKVVNNYREKNLSKPQLVWNKYDSMLDEIEKHMEEGRNEHAMSLCNKAIYILENKLYIKYKNKINESENLSYKYFDYVEIFQSLNTINGQLVNIALSEIYEKVSKVF